MKRGTAALVLVAALALSACGNAAYQAQSPPLPTATPTQATASGSPSTDAPTAPAAPTSSAPVAPTSSTPQLPTPSPCADVAAAQVAESKGKSGPPPPERKREIIPKGFVPVLLIQCATEERTTPADGEWTYIVEQHASEGLDALVAALRTVPPPAPTGEIMCTLEARSDPWFLLIDASGREILPVVPHDNACHKPIELSVPQLQLTSGRAFPVRQQMSPAELATSCPPAFKGPLGLLATGDSAKPFAGRVTMAHLPTSVCVYRTGDDPEVGMFRGGAVVTPAQGRSLAEAMGRVAPGIASDGCRPATDLAVVFAGGEFVHVELSGCHRIFVGGDRFTAPAAAVVAVIEGLQLQH